MKTGMTTASRRAANGRNRLLPVIVVIAAMAVLFSTPVFAAWEGGTLTLSWEICPSVVPWAEGTGSRMFEVSGSYSPNFPSGYERVQSGSLSYDFNWSATPNGSLDNQDDSGNNSSVDVSFSVPSSKMNDKTVSVTCTLTGTVECTGADGFYGTGDDQYYSLSESETLECNVTVADWLYGSLVLTLESRIRPGPLFVNEVCELLVSADYSPNFPNDEVERIQDELAYDFEWDSDEPDATLTNQRDVENTTEIDASFSTVSETANDKRVEVTCDVTAYIEGVGPDGLWDTGDDELYWLLEEGTLPIDFTVIGVDLDIDSDNNNGFSAPDRSRAEELIENDAEEPGKFVIENSDDNDNNGIRDWVEFQVDNETFTPLILQSVYDDEDLIVSVSYDASDPNDLVQYGDETFPSRTPGRGELRIWTQSGESLRSPSSVGDGGDYLAPGSYDWSDLCAGGPGTVTLYVEGITYGETAIGATCKVPDPENPGSFITLASDTVKVTVLPRPRAIDDAFSVTHDTPVYRGSELGSLLINDISVSDTFTGDYPRNVILFDGTEDAGETLETTAGGEVTVDDTGGVVYVPPEMWTGEDTFQYKAGNGDIYSAPATVTVTVTNTVPTTVGESYSVVHGRPLRRSAKSGLLENDTDPEDQAFITATLVDGPSHGALTLFHQSGAFIYTPGVENGADYVGQDSFTYKVEDGIGESDPVTVQINVTNSAPVAAANEYSVSIDAHRLLVAAEDGVLINDSDADGDTLRAYPVQGPSKGTLTLKPSGAFLYTITTPFVGTDTFTYKASDSAVDTDPVTVTIHCGTGAAVTLQDDSYSVTWGHALVVELDNGVLANDSIPGETGDITVELLGAAPQGLTFHDCGVFSYVAGDTLGPVVFSYRVTHDAGLTDEAEVTIQVVNAKPVVEDAGYSIAAGRKLVTDREAGLALKASDADGDWLTFEAGSGEVIEGDDSDGPGEINVMPSGAFVYEPPAEDFVGTVKFSYTANDGVESSDDGEITITVTGGNTPPTAGDRSYTVFQRDELLASVKDGLLVGASDKDGDPMWVTIASPSSLQGLLSYMPGGSFHYTPPIGLTGSGDLDFQESIEFVVHDVTGDTVSATATFHVVNKAPVGTEDEYEVDRDTRLVVSQRSGLLANDDDDDGDPLIAATISDPAHGTLVFAGQSGAFVYEPDEGYVGADTFTYHPNDGFRQGDAVTVTITVNDTDGPVAVNDTYTVMHRNADRILSGAGKRYDVSAAKEGIIAENSLVVSPWKGVLSNDEDPDGRTLTATLVDGPTQGTLTTFDACGSFVYAPTVGYVGDDSFTYRVTDGRHTSEVATVEIEVVNDAPATEADSYQVKPDQTLITSARNGVLGNDLDAQNDPLTAEVLQDVSNGSLNFGAHGGFTYTPEDGFTGNDSFTYRATDGLVYSATTTVTIVVTTTPSPGDPVARNDSYSIRHDATLNVSAGANGVLGNDYTFNDGGLSAELVTGVSHGTLALNASGGFSYEPGTGYVGSDTFTYNALDAYGTSNTATVSIEVTNVVPSAANREHKIHSGDVLEVAWLEGLVASVSDEDGDAVTAALVTDVDPAHGVLVFNNDGSYTFTSATGFKGVADFTYTVSDGIGVSSAGTVTIEVANKRPTAASDTQTVEHDRVLIVNGDKGLLAKSSDGDGDRLTLDVSQLDGLTTWTNGAYIYQPAEGFVGQVAFTYTVHDGTESSAEATVTINVTNEAPVAVNDPSEDPYYYEVRHDRTLVVSAEEGILANDSSPDDDRIWWTDVVDPVCGDLTLNADGSFVYDPNAIQPVLPVDDSFTYRLTDGIATTDPVTVSIRVLYDEPTAADDPVDFAGRKSYRTDRNEPLIIYADDGVLLNDDNPEEVLLSLTNTSPAHGEVDLRENGAFLYTPDTGYSGADSFTYTISDGITESTATVSLSVTGKDLSASDDPGALSSYAVPQDWVFVMTPDEESAQLWPSNAVLAIGSLGSNDTIPDDVTPEFVLVTNVGHGQLHLGDHGGFIYRPDTGYVSPENEPDFFTYKIVTPYGESNVATVKFDVGDISLTASPIDLGTTTRVRSVTGQASYNLAPLDLPADQAPIYPVVASLVDGPSHGSAAVTKDGQVRYTPNGAYIGPDTFTYRWSFNGRQGAPATVSVGVAGSAPSVADLFPDDFTCHLILYVGLDEHPYTSGFSVTDLALDADFDDETSPGITATLIKNGVPTSSPIVHENLGTISIENGKLCYNPAVPVPNHVGAPVMDTFQIRLSDTTSGDGSIATVKVLMYAPHCCFSEDATNSNPITLEKPPKETDGFFAKTQAAKVDALAAACQANTVLAWGLTQAAETRLLAEFNAANTRADSITNAVAAQQTSVAPMLYTLGTVLVDADAERTETESDAFLAEEAAVLAAEVQEWDDATTAAVTYASHVHSSLLWHAQSQATALASQASNASIAKANSEVLLEAEEEELDEDLRLVAVTLAGAQSAAAETYYDNLESLTAQYKTDMRTQAQARDVLLKAAHATLRASQQQIRTDLQTALDSAAATHETVVQAALSDRDDALAIAQSDLDTAVAAAAAIYAAGDQDQNITEPLALGDNADYLAVVACAQATYDAAVVTADGAYDNAIAAARAVLDNAILTARATASTAVATADADFREDLDDAEALYDSLVLGAVQLHDGQVLSGRAQLLLDFALAWDAYTLDMHLANTNLDTATQSATLALYNDGIQALEGFDNACVSALNDYESAMTPLDSAYCSAVNSHRNTYDVGRIDAQADFLQARETADTTYRQANQATVDACELAVFNAAESKNDTVDAAREQLDVDIRNAEHTKAVELADADQTYRDIVRAAQIEQHRVTCANAFKTYAIKVQQTQELLAKELDWGVLRRWTFILNPDTEGPVAKVRASVYDLVKAGLVRGIAEAQARMTVDADTAPERVAKTNSYNDAYSGYYDDVANAVKTFENAKAAAQKDFGDARVQAEATKLTMDATQRTTWAIAIADAGADWREDIADLTRTWLRDNGQARYTYAVGQAQARADHGSDLAGAFRGLSDDLAFATGQFATANISASSNWKSAHDSASSQLATDRAAAIAAYMTDLAGDEADLNNSIATYATNLFVAVSQSGETHAAALALALSNYVTAETYATEVFQSDILDASETHSGALRTAFANLVQDVHDGRVAAVAAWHAVENTNWSTYVYSVALAERDFAEDEEFVHTSWFDDAGAVAITFANTTLSEEADAVNDTATAAAAFSLSSTSAITAYENAAKLLSLALTTGCNTEQATYLAAMSTSAINAESAIVGHMQVYNAAVTQIYETLMTTAVSVGTTLQSALADADELLATSEAGDRQDMNVAMALGAKTYGDTCADVARTLGIAEAVASATHASAVWPAWQTERSGAVTAGKTVLDTWASADKTFNDAWAAADAARDSSYGGYEAAERTAVTTADNIASAVECAQEKARLESWQDEVIPDLANHSLSFFLELYPIGEIALASLEPKWWEGFIPVYGSLYSGCNNISKGEYLWGAVDLITCVFEGMNMLRTGKAIFARLGSGAERGRASALAKVTKCRAGAPIGCFVAGTLIYTAGGFVPIESVLPGQQVYAYDHAAEEWALAEVEAVHGREYEGQIVTLTIEYADGSHEVIEATGNHPFWVEAGENLASRPAATEEAGSDDAFYVSATGGRYVEARHLSLGDRLLAKDYRSATVSGLAIRNERLKVYNLTVLRMHNYAVGQDGILVHNTKTCGIVLGEHMPRVRKATRVSEAKKLRCWRVSGKTFKEYERQGIAYAKNKEWLTKQINKGSRIFSLDKTHGFPRGPYYRKEVTLLLENGYRRRFTGDVLDLGKKFGKVKLYEWFRVL